MKLLIFSVLHIIGAVTAIILHWKDGTIKFACKYGDGIRFARPSDIIFMDLIIWEFLLIIAVVDFIENYINKKCIS